MLAWLLLGGVSFAQESPAPATLTGRVLERGSGLPVAARVAIGDQWIDTAEDGTFRWEGPAGDWLVSIEADGHLPYQVTETISPGGALDVVYRVERASWTDEITVYGEERREEVSRTVFSAEELKLVPGSFGDPLRALQSLPGVARPSVLEGDLVVRGAEGLNTGTYVDGVPVPYLFHFFVGRSVINPALLDDVEFFAGGMPSRFGDVTQAVVNARTLDTSPEPGVHGRISADPMDFAVSMEGRLGPNLTWQGGYRVAWGGALFGLGMRTYAAARFDSGFVPEYPTIGYQDHLLRASWEAGPDRVTATVFGAHDLLRLHPSRSDIDGDGDSEPDPIDPHLPFDPYRLMELGFERVHVRWDRNAGGREQRTEIALGPELEQNLVPGIGQLSDGIEMGRYSAWSGIVRRVDRLPIGEHALAFGVDGTATPSKVEDYANWSAADKPVVTKDLRLTGGVWAEAQLEHGGWYVAPGLRGSAHSFNDRDPEVQPEPRLTVRRDLGDRWTATAFAGRFSQVPPADRYAEGIGNPDIGLMTAWQGSTGLVGRWPGGLEIDVSAYGSRTADLVVKDFEIELRDDLDPVVPGEPRATGEIVPVFRSVTGYAYGVEAMVRHRPVDGWFGWVAVNVGRSLREGEDGALVPGDHDQPFALTLVGARTMPKEWRVSGRYRLTSGHPFTPLHGVYQPQWQGWFPYSGDENADRFPVFHQLDVRADKTWTGDRARWTAFLDIHNAYNAKNMFWASYDETYTELVPEFWIPILPTLGLEVTY
jgi:hypothetical protein